MKFAVWSGRFTVEHISGGAATLGGGFYFFT